MFTYIPSLEDLSPPFPTPPLYVITEPWAEFTVLYSCFLLAICCINTHDGISCISHWKEMYIVTGRRGILSLFKFFLVNSQGTQGSVELRAINVHALGVKNPSRQSVWFFGPMLKRIGADPPHALLSWWEAGLSRGLGQPCFLSADSHSLSLPSSWTQQFCGRRSFSDTAVSSQTPWVSVAWRKSLTASRRDTLSKWWRRCSRSGGSASSPASHSRPSSSSPLSPAWIPSTRRKKTALR